MFVQDVDLEAMPTSIFLNDDDGDEGVRCIRQQAPIKILRDRY